MSSKIDKVEHEKRLRIVQEWLIDDWPYSDIVSNIIGKWGISERQAKRYIATARARWVDEEHEKVERKRAMKVVSLKKLKRSLKDNFKGTPGGIRAIVAVEKELIKLEGLAMPKQISVGGIKDAPPIPVVGKITHNLVVKRCDK